MSASSALESIIKNYISSVSLAYDISELELTNMWYGKSSTAQKATSKSSVSIDDNSTPTKETPKKSKLLGSNTELSKLTKNELVEHCKLRNLKVTGTKSDLIERLTGTKQEPVTKETKAPAKTTPGVKTTVQKKEKELAQTEVVKGLFQVKQVAYKIVKNEFGNFWHSETQLVYDRDLKKFYGKQNSNGRVVNMTEEDVEVCNKYKFPFVMPDNMIKTEKVTVTELDEDELVGDDEEEIVDDEGGDEEEMPLADEE